MCAYMRYTHTHTHTHIYIYIYMPITVAARSKAWTVFGRSNAGIMGSNPIQDMDACVRVYSVFVLSCV
jgi:hypothetical protein